MIQVSILVANYNNAKYLNDFFQSIIDSKFSNLEVVIVDDGSSDQSINIIREIIYQNPELNINLIPLKENVGFANALNIGMIECQGKYIVRIDPDDKLYPSRLNKQYEFLEKNNHIDVLGTNATIFSGDKELFKSNMEAEHQWIESKYRKGEHGTLHPTLMIKASEFKRFKYIQSNVPAEDYDIFSRMIIDGCKFANIIEPLTYYRVHADSVSNYLPYSTVEKTFSLCQDIFGVKYSKFKIYSAYYSRKNYRKYLFTENIFYLIIASIFNPDAVLRRFKKINIFRSN